MRATPLLRTLLLLCFGAAAAACGETAVEPGGAGGGGGTGDGGSGGGGDGQCTTDADCKTGGTNFCAASDDGQCGPVVHQCIVYPASCGEGTLRTVCGCDGLPHVAGPCPSATLAVQIDTRPGACVPPAGMFFCGEGTCTIGTQYCVEAGDAVSCADLPAECVPGTPSCACLETAGLTACGCVDEPDGGIRVNGCGL